MALGLAEEDAPLGEGPPPKFGLGDEEPSGPLDEFETEIRAAFPDNDWTPERVMAMKEAIRLCVEKDAAGGYGKPPPKKGDGPDLAIVFGEAEKKRK